ncbi:MAG: transaldolase [Bacteroidota bacterium]
MIQNPLLELEALGQSIWIDFLRRETTRSGELKRLIEEDGVSGVTSNPSIFEKAIAESHDYDESIRVLNSEGKTAADIFQSLAVEDIQQVADLLRPTYDHTDGQDGFVSLEVSPTLAHDTQGTIREARRLWSQVNRPNCMIKVPATREGLPAIKQLISEGLNINITLLFGLPRYREVANAYIAGLEALAGQGKGVRRISSVASFFLSRIDTFLYPLIEKRIGTVGSQAEIAARLQGQVAIASAKVAYQIYKEMFGSQRFQRLVDQGARSQRLLWASTSTKNPAYIDTKYIDPLIGPNTINTMPIETLNAYRDHGQPKQTLEENVAEAHQVFLDLPALGIDLDKATQQLEDQGVQKFSDSLNKLMASLQEKQAALLGSQLEK